LSKGEVGTLVRSACEIFQDIRQDIALGQRFRRYELALQYVSGRDVLEMGCELGVGAYHLAGNARTVLGIDHSEEWLAEARELFQRNNLRFALMDCAHLALADAIFDVVCLFEVIEHVADPTIVLSEAKRALTPGGLFLLSTPNRLVSRAGVGPLPQGDHIREFSYLELRDLVRRFFAKSRFYGQESMEILPLAEANTFPEFRAFSRFLVVCTDH